MTPKISAPPPPIVGQKNLLYYGDNLDILRKHIKDESIDLIYLDPPFNSKVNYNVIFQNKDKKDSPAQIQAFDDTWSWTSESEIAYGQLMNTKIGTVMSGLREIVGTNDLMAYLVMMAIRLIELHRVLKNTGSLYLHCDPTTSHYLRVILDAVFGIDCFRNEIIWKRSFGGKIIHQSSLTYSFDKMSDTILFYAKSDHRIKSIFTWTEKFKKSFNLTDKDGRQFHTSQIILSPSMRRRPNQEFTYKGYTPPFGWKYIRESLEKLDDEGRLYWNSKGKPYKKVFLDESIIEIGSVWDDIQMLSSNDKEILGYPTQKPLSLLERIISASSNEGDIILDPFCGCGTAIIAAEKLHRNWVGIDTTHLAVSLIEKRLYDSFRVKSKIIGVPQSL